MSLPPGLALYRGATALLAGPGRAVLTRRAAAGKEDPARLGERMGRASLPRPDGTLVWLHAASVGESLAALSLAAMLMQRRKDMSVLITSGTRTAAGLIARRGAEGVIHQYPPADQPGWTRRFTDHWRPDLAVFVESELWPNLILAARRSGARLALVNARMNEASLRRWARWPGSIRRLLDAFDWIGAADARTAEGLTRLSGRETDMPGNIKLEAGLPDPDPGALSEARAVIGKRPVFVAASTHRGEEALMIEAHRLLLETRPDALMVLAPRHPERRKEAEALLSQAGLSFAIRSRGEAPGPGDPVWLADTLGEMELWFRLCPAAVICGSFVEGVGGHNPVEATRGGASVITGPHADSFADVYAAYEREKACQSAENAEELAACITAVWNGAAPDAQAGLRALNALPGGALGATADRLIALLDMETRR